MEKKIITLENRLKVGVYTWGGENETTLLFLHGLGSTGASFDGVANMLSSKFRILAFDLPGHGKSTFLREEKRFSAEALSDWVVAVLKQLDINQIHIAGHSIGGNIGLALAGENVAKSLILLDGGYIRASSLPGSSLEEEVRMAEQHCENLVFASWDQYEADSQESGLSASFIELAKLGMKMDGNQVKMILPSEIAGFYMRQHFHEPHEKILTKVKLPVLLLRSSLPTEFNSHRAKETDRLSEHVAITVETVNGASHDIYWDQPEIISASITRWVKRFE